MLDTNDASPNELTSSSIVDARNPFGSPRGASMAAPLVCLLAQHWLQWVFVESVHTIVESPEIFSLVVSEMGLCPHSWQIVSSTRNHFHFL
jgi:hypothetical protein